MADRSSLPRLVVLAVLTAALALACGGEARAVNATDICFVETGADDSGKKLRTRLADWAADDPEGTIAVWTGQKVETATDPVTTAWAIDWFVTQPFCGIIVANTKPPRLPIFVVRAVDGPNQTALLVAGMLGFKELIVYVYGTDQVGPQDLPKLKQETQELLQQYGFRGTETRFEECSPHCRGEPLRTRFW